MMSEDFLFCGGGTISTARQEEKTEELAAPLSMSQVPRKEDCAPSRRRESTTTSRRRSARLSVHTNLTGSIFIDQEENSATPDSQRLGTFNQASVIESRLPIPSSPTGPLLSSASLTADKAVDAIDSKTPIVGSPNVVKSVAVTPLFNNTLAPLRVVNKAKTKSRLGKEMQKALGDLTNLETKEGRLLKGRAATRTNRGRRGVPLAENSPPESRQEGKHTKKKPQKQHQKEPTADLSGEQVQRGSLGELTDRRSKEERPRSGEGGSRRSSGLAGADISLPESARRSITGEFLPQRSQQNSPAFTSNERDSDSDEEVISGIFGKKTFGPKKMKEESIDNAFLLT